MGEVPVTSTIYMNINSHIMNEKMHLYRWWSHASQLNNVRQNVSFDPGLSQTFGLDALVSLLRQENAVDICVIKVPEQIKYTEYFIVVSGVSPRHLRAMALYAIKVVTKVNFLF